MKQLVLVLLALFATAAMPAMAGARAPARAAAGWQTMARNDLKSIHALIVASHPGVIDEANPGFNDWVESGYRQALALVPQADSYDSALSVVRYYTSGFLDGHVFYSDDIRSSEDTSLFDGWTVDYVHGKYIVVATLPDWPVTQPPVGSELVACDGRSADAIIRQDVAPFEDRRDDPGTRHAQAISIGLLHLSSHRLRQCRFGTVDGKTLDLGVAYRPVSLDVFFKTLGHVTDGGKRPENGYSFQDGVLWVRAANFQLQAGTPEASGLETMLKGMAGLSGVKRIVFDARGNNGGDSSVGERIFDAATGGLEYDRTGIERLPRVYAQWRVSDALLASATERLARDKSLYGDTSDKTVESAKFLDDVKAAKAARKAWLEQDGDYRITRADIAARHGRLRRFDGNIALLTDAGCVSACLDFADLVRLVPGAIHLGQTTSSDTVYIDVAHVKLPSGNHMVLPLKVWRNRLRGNAEPLVPDIPLDVDMDDDAAVRHAVLAALGGT